jgi:uncharacterized membrane protein YadS
MNSLSDSTPSFWRSEDATAMLIAWSCLFIVFAATFLKRPVDYKVLVEEIQSIRQAAIDDSEKRVEQLKSIDARLAPSVFKDYWFKASDWVSDPREAFMSKGDWQFKSMFATSLVLAFVLMVGCWWQRQSVGAFAMAFVILMCLTILAFVLSSQSLLKYANLEYPLWALMVGLIIANTIGCPEWLKPAVRPDLFVKIGLVLLGAEVLFGKLLVLGLPGILVSWTVTPIVLIGTYVFGQRVLRMESRSLNMVISADMSVCGVSAAIATAAACKAKKEELSLAIALSLIFTVLMMVVMPFGIRAVGMNPVIAGAWLGGTIDSTGAVAAASELLKSSTATEVATTVKMIQNILIGVFAFGIAAYWSTYIDSASEADASKNTRSGLAEIWRRFPKFALGFLITSIVVSSIQSSGIYGNALVQSVVDGTSKHLRAWFFCLAFVAIGLESNFRDYWGMIRNGKALTLYLVGQAFNLALSLSACYVVFQYLFPGAMQSLMR